MAYLFEQLDSDEYWTRFAARVRPHVGDLQALFKHPWRSGFSMEFSDVERSLCREALRRRAPIEHWVLRYLPTSRQPGAELAHGERYAFGFTLEQVVARLHEDCFDRQFLPTSVSLAEAALRFEFYDREELFACIERVKFCTAPAGSARSAAETFLATLAAGGRDETAVLQMLAEWPGAQGLQVAKLQGSFRRIVTPPTLDNWFTQSTELLRRATAKPDTPQAARELVAAVMDAASFEALEQAMEAHTATGVYPVLVESEVQGGSVHFDVYPDISSALPGFVELATQVTAEGPGPWEFEAGSYSSAFAIEFRRVPSDESTQPASPQQSRSVSLATMPIADHDEASGAACAALANAGSDVERFTLLREIFLIDRPASERTREIDRHNKQTAIYEDRFGLRVVVKGELPKTTWSNNGAVRRGNVVFAFASATPDDGDEDNYVDEPGKIHIERIDEHGGVLCQTLSVPLDEAGLLYCLEERAWVLTSGPCFRAPSGVIRGIDDGGLRVLYFVLGCNRGGPATDFITELTMRSPEFQEEMAELIRDGFVV